MGTPLYDFAHHDLRYDVLRRRAADRRPRARVQALNECDYLCQLGLLQLQLTPQAVVIVGCEQTQVVRHHGQRFVAPRRVFGQPAQLEGEALAQIARAHPDRVELLNAFEHRQHFLDLDVWVLSVEHRREVFEIGGEHAVGVDRVDQRGGDRVIGR